MEIIICPGCNAQITQNESVGYDAQKNKLYIKCFNCQYTIIIFDLSEIEKIKTDLQQLIVNIQKSNSKKKK